MDNEIIQHIGNNQDIRALFKAAERLNCDPASYYLDRRGHLVVPGEDVAPEARTAIYARVRYKNSILFAWPKFGNGFADLPGGGIEAQEVRPVALAREWWEETGLAMPFTPIRVPDGHYEQRLNFYAEDANRFLQDYHQIFVAYDDPGNIPHGFLARERWSTPEGDVSWVPIDQIRHTPINRAHWPAITSLVPELRGVELAPASRFPRKLSPTAGQVSAYAPTPWG
ncbi:MAG: NUDIX hydrolase [Alphaproteobacteria bacterium]